MPTLIAAVIPERVLVRWDKQMLAASIGAICSFLFIELIPSTFGEIGAHWKEYENPKRSCILFSCAILLGILISVLLDLLDADRGSRTADTANATEKNNTTCSLSHLPGAVKSIMLATVLHNVLDGILIAFEPMIAIPLLIHELTHAVGQMAIYVNLGLSKRKALLLRFITDLFIPIAAVVAWCVETAKNLKSTIQIYGFLVLVGMFLYIMLVDLVPIVMRDADDGDVASTDSDVEADKDDDSTVHRQHKCKGMASMAVCFILAFGAVTAIILVTDHNHNH